MQLLSCIIDLFTHATATGPGNAETICAAIAALGSRRNCILVKQDPIYFNLSFCRVSKIWEAIAGMYGSENTIPPIDFFNIVRKMTKNGDENSEHNDEDLDDQLPVDGESVNNTESIYMSQESTPLVRGAKIF